MVIVAKTGEGEKWTTGTYGEILDGFKVNMEFNDYPRITAAEIMSIATKSDPKPVKNLSKRYVESLPGQYLGRSNMIEQLQNDKITIKVQSKQIQASRWLMFNVEQEYRTEKHDEESQHHMIHGNSKVWIGENKSCTPSEELTAGTRIIAVRKYMGGPYTATVNLAYYFLPWCASL